MNTGRVIEKGKSWMKWQGLYWGNEKEKSVARRFHKENTVGHCKLHQLGSWKSSIVWTVLWCLVLKETLREFTLGNTFYEPL
jgi:hypothetical protein